MASSAPPQVSSSAGVADSSSTLAPRDTDNASTTILSGQGSNTRKHTSHNSATTPAPISFFSGATSWRISRRVRLIDVVCSARFVLSGCSAREVSGTALCRAALTMGNILLHTSVGQNVVHRTGPAVLTLRLPAIIRPHPCSLGGVGYQGIQCFCQRFRVRRRHQIR